MTLMPRKAFLLAAGHGTRLRPLTDRIPKCLLPVHGVPMLQIWLSQCKRFGIEEILINLHSNAEVVRTFLSRNPVSGVCVRVIDEPSLLGSAGTIHANKQWVQNETAFWIFYADVLTDANLHGMAFYHFKQKAAATLGVYRVSDPSRCGIVQLDKDGWITQFIEKPKEPQGNLAFSGILLCGSEFLDVLPQNYPCDIGFDVLPKLVGRIAAYEIRDYLIDIGTMENYESAQKDWSAAQPFFKEKRSA